MATSTIQKGPITIPQSVDISSEIVSQYAELIGDGVIRYVVKNDICFVKILNLKIGTVPSSGTVIVNGLPAPGISWIYDVVSTNNQKHNLLVENVNGEGKIKVGPFTDSGTFATVLSYPISVNWTP